MKVRKKPVEIEVVFWNGKQLNEVPEWLSEALYKLMPIGNAEPTGAVMRIGNDIHISSLEGIVICEPNNYIARGIQGELYTIKKDIFDLTYDIL